MMLSGILPVIIGVITLGKKTTGMILESVSWENLYDITYQLSFC